MAALICFQHILVSYSFSNNASDLILNATCPYKHAKPLVRSFKSNNQSFTGVLLRQYLTVVFTDVSVSVPGLCECLSTVGAGVWPLSCVYPHVNIQFVFANKAFVAAGACVRFVPRVITLVHLQLRHATVSSAALGTLVAGTHLHVLPAVQPQPAGRPEALAALRTLEGFLSGVDVDV